MNLSSKVLDKCGIVDAAILGDAVKETGDSIVDYARVFSSLRFISFRVHGQCITRRWKPYLPLLEDTASSFLL